jgi:hypothetical protein
MDVVRVVTHSHPLMPILHERVHCLTVDACITKIIVATRLHKDQ